MREQILCYALKYQGEWQKITQAIADQEEWEIVPYEGSYLTIYDEEYPDCLRQLQYAPWILFYEGDIRLLQEKKVSVIGSRNPDAYGTRMANTITTLLKDTYVIVSGLAKGIDACAHQAALDKKTIGVIGCGLDVIYPKENAALYEAIRKQQLLISEYPKGSKPLAHHFPWRNRIIAALSKAVIVIQAKKRSGTLLTVNEALELDIPVYCVPHTFADPYGEGGNLLISQGANILLDEDDVFAI